MSKDGGKFDKFSEYLDRKHRKSFKEPDNDEIYYTEFLDKIIQGYTPIEDTTISLDQALRFGERRFPPYQSSINPDGIRAVGDEMQYTYPEDDVHFQIINSYGTTTPLHTAGKVGNLAAFKTLIEYGVDPANQDYDKKTPLHHLAEKDPGKVLELLDSFSKGDVPEQLLTSLTIKDSEGKTPLTIKDSDGKTPLHHLAEQNPAKFFELLANSGDLGKDAQKKLFECLTIKDNSGERPLAIIAKKSGEDSKEYFQNLDKNISAVLKKGGLEGGKTLDIIIEKLKSVFQKITKADQLYQQTVEQQQRELSATQKLFNGMRLKLESQKPPATTATAPASPALTLSSSSKVRS